ncbi:hypothetical protein ACFLZL_05520 [Thermodesulfobacteriota bacterium]
MIRIGKSTNAVVLCVNSEIVYIPGHMDGHLDDYGSDTLYTKGLYALRPPGTVHGPFGTKIGCTLLEVVWYDKDYYLENR